MYLPDKLLFRKKHTVHFFLARYEGRPAGSPFRKDVCSSEDRGESWVLCSCLQTKLCENVRSTEKWGALPTVSGEREGKTHNKVQAGLGQR